MDPIADEFPHLSVFNYASNDPIRNVDLHGLQGIYYGDALKNEAFRKANDLRLATNEGVKANIDIYNSDKTVRGAHDVYFVFQNLENSRVKGANASTFTFSSDAIGEDGYLKTNSQTKSILGSLGLLGVNLTNSKEPGNDFSIIVFNTAKEKTLDNAMSGGEEAILKLAESIYHELKAHIITRLEGNYLESRMEEEHKAYFGEARIDTPSIDKPIKEGTPRKKFVDEARKIQKDEKN